jgi:putative nucleotidyltransferase with HDIG domain
MTTTTNNNNNNTHVYRFIRELYDKKGNDLYMISEPITQKEHAVQTYIQMTKLCADRPALLLAALLHDIGHLTSSSHEILMTCEDFVPMDPICQVDDRHEEVGAELLKNLGFGPDVVEPVRLHVLAKRYLCSTQLHYYEQLSQGSKLSFDLQGGLMTMQEQQQFESNPWFQDALLLRKCDDEAKQVNLLDIPSFHVVFVDTAFLYGL